MQMSIDDNFIDCYILIDCNGEQLTRKKYETSLLQIRELICSLQRIAQNWRKTHWTSRHFVNLTKKMYGIIREW